MKISLCMIVKNEERNIINCLNRALTIVDEAIIVDTGSADKTKQLLKECYGSDDRVKLVQHIWENDFSKARNESLRYVTGDWILVLDADERLFGDRKGIEEILKKENKKAFIIPIYNVLDGDNISITSTMIRLFKNENPKYKGSIHEQIEIDGKSFMPDIIDGNICRLYHYGYAKKIFTEKDKQNRNMDIIKTEIENDPKNPFNWYNKGVMEMIQENYETAIDDFLKSNELTHKKRMGFHNDLIVRVIQCMMILKKYKQAIKFIKEVSKDLYIKEIPDIYYYCGIAYSSIKEYNMAIKYFKKAIDTKEYEKGTSKFGSGSFLPKIAWAKVLVLQNKKELAIEKFKEAVLDKNNVNKQGLDELKYLLKQENLTDELEKLELVINKENHKREEQISSDEFEKYKNQAKDNIKELVENGILEEAKKLITEYEEIVKNDVDVYSIKGVMAMMEGDMDEAERVLKEGFALDFKNFDLLYNLGYLYETNNNSELAIKYYKKALKNVKDEEIKDSVYEILKALGVEESKEEIIRDVINEEKILLEKAKEESNPSSEMKNLQKQFKENIQSLIEQGSLEEAKQMVAEYEQIVKDDIDVYSIKGVIAMMEGDMDEAEKVLKEGLNVGRWNRDLLYNLAYLYEIQENFISAYDYYNKLYKVVVDEKLIDDVCIKIKELKENKLVKEYEEIRKKKDEKSPKITIETWAYNAERYIRECAESVLNQSFKDFEWIIFDNGCTDLTSEILEEYAKKDNRIKIFKNKMNTFIHNEPVNPDFVKHTENLTSEYWCRLDSDDYLHVDFLKELYTAAKKNDTDIAIVGTEMFKEENTKIRGLRCPPNFYINDIINLGDIFQQVYGSFRPIWGKLFKVSTTKNQLYYRRENLKFKSMKNGADTIFCIDFLRFCNSVVGINKPLYYYRIRKESFYNTSIDKNRYLDYVHIYNESQELLESWNKLNDDNLNFITSVLYYSLKDCISISVNSNNVSIEYRVEVINNILSDKKVRQIFNKNGLLINLLDESTNAIDELIKDYRKNYKK